MKIFLKAVWNMLAVFGIISLIVFTVLLYLIFTNPFIGALISPGGSSSTYQSDSSTEGETADQNSALSAEQEAALRGFGIDPAALPSELTPEMEACFVSKLGQSRVDEIKGGASPTAVDFFKAQGCLNS